jgi:hypothetical protein
MADETANGLSAPTLFTKKRAGGKNNGQIYPPEAGGSHPFSVEIKPSHHAGFPSARITAGQWIRSDWKIWRRIQAAAHYNQAVTVICQN